MDLNHIHNRQKQESSKASKGMILLRKTMVLAIIFSIILNSQILVKVSRADATTSVGVAVDYKQEVVKLFSNQSTRFYISTDTKDYKNWDLIDTGITVENGSNVCYMDISSLLTTKTITVFFKGNKDGKVVPYQLKGEEKSLTASYKVVDGVGRIEYSATLPVEFRKGSYGAWNPVTTAPFYTSIYEIKGATLFFRTAATETTRAGKAVQVKVPKRPSAPSVKLDGSKLSITGLKSGSMRYRVGDNDWVTFNAPDSKIKTLDLSYLLGGSTTNNTPIPAGIIEFQTIGADKKPNSVVKILDIPAQRVMANTQASVTGSALAIHDVNTKTQYEYAILGSASGVDLSKMKWSTITSRKSVVIKKVAIGDKIIVRMKSYTDSATKQTVPASTYIVLSITSITPGR